MTRDPTTAVLDGRANSTGERVFVAVSGLVFIASIAGTIYFCGSMSGGMRMQGGWTMSMAWMRMPDHTWLNGAGSFVGVWTMMMVAMMLPSLMPMLVNYRRSVRRAGLTRLGRLTVIAGIGYFLVWVIFGTAAYLLGVSLAAAEMRWSALARCVPIATGVTLLITGLVQFTGWKVRQLALCRNPLACNHTTSLDAGNSLRHGLHLGLHCALCCFGLMIILLVTGVMNLAVMLVVTIAITAERLVPAPRRAARVIGVIIIVAGVFVIVRALGII